MPPETKIPNNSEIDKALKEFEEKSRAEQAQKPPEAGGVYTVPQKEISGIRFETDSYRRVESSNETDVPKMVKLVMKLSGGAIKEQKQAEYVLLAFVILAMGVSIYLFFFSGHTPAKPTAAELKLMQGTINN